MPTSLPKNVEKDKLKLMEWYNSLEEITIDEIIEFNFRFEKIHPFQDGNGRYYYRGLKEYKNEKEYLVETCLNAQDQYKRMIEDYLKG